MPWYQRLDNEGKKTELKRFFTDKQESALLIIMKKRPRWVKCNEPLADAVLNQNTVVDNPAEEKISLSDVHNTDSVDELNEMLKKPIKDFVKKAIEKKIKRLNFKK